LDRFLLYSIDPARGGLGGCPETYQVTAAIEAIHNGDVDRLKDLLREDQSLITARVDGARTLLHVATDWPGHFPNGAVTVKILIEAGADVDAPFIGRHQETPLHWAASSDDVEVLDTLLDHGANIEAGGGVIGGGTPLSDAVAFGQWNAARRLIERGAQASLWEAAALGLIDRVKSYEGATAEEITNAFWCACHGGQRETAEYLLGRGADLNWVGYDRLTSLGAAERSGAKDVVVWLRNLGAQETAGREPAPL
jgi:ankyrin repeat protein